MNKWIQHVKQVQAKHGCSYKDALIIAKQSYKKGGMVRRNRDLIIGPGEHVPAVPAIRVPDIPLGTQTATPFANDLLAQQVDFAHSQFIDQDLEQRAREAIQEDLNMEQELFLEAGRMYGGVSRNGFPNAWGTFIGELRRQNLTTQDVRALPSAQRRRLLRQYFDRRSTCIASGIKKKRKTLKGGVLPPPHNVLLRNRFYCWIRDNGLYNGSNSIPEIRLFVISYSMGPPERRMIIERLYEEFCQNEGILPP